MLVLYMRPSCSYSKKVAKAAREIGILLEERDITDTANAAALKKRGGKLQVPYIVDARNGVELYESAAIIAYMRERPRPCIISPRS